MANMTFDKVGEMLEEMVDVCYIRSGVGNKNYDIDTPIEDIYIIIEPSEDMDEVCIWGGVMGNYVDGITYTYNEKEDKEYNKSIFMDAYAKVFGIAAEHYMYNYGLGY